MRPDVTLPDPEKVVVDILNGALGAGTAATDYPSTTLAATAVRVQVDAEGGSTAGYPVTERTQVRVTAHLPPGKRTAVKQMAASVLGILYTSTTPGVAGIVPQVGRSAVSVDPDTRNVMCWVLVRVDLLAAPILAL